MRSLTLRTLVCAAVMLLVAGVGMAQNALDVPGDGTCAMSGTNFGLRTVKDGAATNKVWVRDDTPANEAIYRASFWIDPTNLSFVALNPKNKLGIAIANAPVAGRAAIKVQIIWGQNQSKWFVNCQLFKNLDELVQLGGTNSARSTVPIELISGPQEIQVEWTASSTPPGSCTVTNLTTAETASETLKNAQLSVDSWQMGMPGPRKINATGTLCFDEFASFRTLAP